MLTGTLAFIFTLLFIVFVILAINHYARGDRLFKSMEKVCPGYYKQIGKPLFFGDIVSNWRAQNYLMSLTIRGVPQDFPADSTLVMLARKTRVSGIIALVYLGIVIIMVHLIIVLLND